jgi:hypothetical protein
MREDLKANLTRRETWLRGLFILLLGLLGFLGQLILVAAVVFQFVSTVITAERNHQLLAFTRALASWLHQVMDYISFNRDQRPWPFDTWPAPYAPALDRED